MGSTEGASGFIDYSGFHDYDGIYRKIEELHAHWFYDNGVIPKIAAFKKSMGCVNKAMKSINPDVKVKSPIKLEVLASLKKRTGSQGLST